jgi:uncharacterized RDD family membrane protein YckC
MYDNVNFNTTQNVNVEYKVAGLYDRIVASFIDGLILFSYSIIITIIYGFTLFMGASYYFTILFIPVIFYDLICESLMQGTTIGKKVMKIRVVSLNGTEPTFIQYFLRWILRIVDFWISSGGVATITIFFNGKGQRLGDIAAGTCVITYRDNIKLTDTILEDIKSDYVPEFPEVSILSDNDIQIIKGLIKASKMPEYPDNVVTALYMAKSKLEEKLSVKSNMQPIDFLNKIIKDYNYYNQSN